jgi:hypothetical protein
LDFNRLFSVIEAGPSAKDLSFAGKEKKIAYYVKDS